MIRYRMPISKIDKLVRMGFENDKKKEPDLTDSDDENDNTDSYNEVEPSNDNDDVPDIYDIELTSKEKYYFKMVDKYYKNLDDIKIKQMIDILNFESNISLRLLDWFVTRYANKFKTNYMLSDNSDNPGERFSVHISYKAHLKSYKKKYFDPFKRRKKFKYCFDKNDKDVKTKTTIGQMNFFRWIFTNEVLTYIENNYDEISKAMAVSNKKDKTRKLLKKKTVGTNISISSDDTSKTKKKVDEVKVIKNGISITAKKKQVVDNDFRIVLSFEN